MSQIFLSPFLDNKVGAKTNLLDYLRDEINTAHSSAMQVQTVSTCTGTYMHLKYGTHKNIELITITIDHIGAYRGLGLTYSL